MTDGLPAPRRYWAAATIWLGLTLSVIDGSIANVALPTIAGDLNAAPAEAIWVINAYQLAIVVSLLPLAALGETVGYRRVFIVGLVLFTAASLGCTLVQTLAQLAGMRAVQGFGAAGMMSVNGALVRFTYPQSMLGRGVGLNALVASLSAAVGPTVASAVLSLGPWQWLFAINIPTGIAALVIGRSALPDSPRTGSVDVLSAALNVLTFGLVFAGIDLLSRAGAVALGAGALVTGSVTGLLLVWRSLSQRAPLVPVDLLKSRLFTLTVLTSIASFTAQMLAFVALPFFFQAVMHRSQVETGLLMTPWPLAIGVAAPLAGRLADRYSAAILAGVGLSVMTLGLVLLSALPTDASTAAIVWRMVLCGLGFGFFQSPNNRTMLSSAPMSRAGAAGGMLATARLTGQTSGATIAAVIFHLAPQGESTALAVAGLCTALGAIASLSRYRFGRAAAAPS